jgi:hypothetical protein
MIPRKNALPVWNRERRELRFRRHLVKRFLRPAKNQQLIIAAFAELRWPERMENPVGGPHKRAHEHLRDAVKKLNRGQDILRFHADGTGQGIRWEVVGPKHGRPDRTHIAPRLGD